MKKTLLLAGALLLCFWVSAQNGNNYGKIVNFNLTNFKSSSLNAVANTGLISGLSVNFPLYDGLTVPFVFNETLISTEKIDNIQTFDAVSSDGKIQMKITITPSGMNGIMHTADGYFFIEPINIKKNEYRIYQSSEVKNASITCDQHQTSVEINLDKNKNKRMLSVAPFPVGTELRTYKLATAATGEMTTLYGSQDNALAQIVSIANANNLIYQLEASIKFELVIQTLNKTIIFTNPATDPFVFSDPPVTPNVPISVDICQAGFVTMNTNGTLPYTAYGIGHTFNTLAAVPNSSSGNGVAGPTPCVDDSKSRGFTQWTLGSPLSLIINIFTHEVAHQFASFHTYNATGGTSANSTFCLMGWDATSAIEPGSGTTMMSYANNCVNPVSYTMKGNNTLQYFNAKSLEQIFTTINTAPTNTCLVRTPTGNTAPVAVAGVGITIPKATPFTLNGSATDADGDAMTYTWEQYDLATVNDRGALGRAIIGVGGYAAVNSTTAPLFRSERSTTSTSRTFPKISYIANNDNSPDDLEGEALPEVARTMKFRFTVRDNRVSGGGIDSDEIIVTVAAAGPLQVSAFNAATTMAAGSNQTVTWNVNNTNTLVANVKILLSIDEGKTFPYVLLGSTPNNGSASVTIPVNVPNTSQGRIKVTCEINPNTEFFDLNNANITITSSCLAKTTVICSDSTITGLSGNSRLNLGLNYVTGSITGGTFSKTYPTTGLTQQYPIINYTDNSFTTCQTSTWSNSLAVLVPFRVTKKGNYSFSPSASSGSAYYSIFTSNSTFNCTTFVGSNNYGAIGAETGSRIIALNECATYYALLYLLDGQPVPTNVTFNIQSGGVGEIIEVQPDQAGFNYTYVAVNQANSQITATNATADFTTLSAGRYRVHGLSYVSTFNPTTLLNQTIAQVISTGPCLMFSSNSKPVTVTGAVATPAPTGSASQTFCSGKTVGDLVATGTAIQWYSASTGGSALTASILLVNGTIYYASQTVSGVESSSRLAVTATVNLTPTLVVGSSTNPTPPNMPNGSIAFTTNLPNGTYIFTYTGTGSPRNVSVSSGAFTLSGLISGTYGNFMLSSNGCIGTDVSVRTLTTAPTNVISIATGNWESNTTWNVGRPPQAGDVVTIDTGHTVKVNATGTAKNMTIKGILNYANAGIIVNLGL